MRAVAARYSRNDIDVPLELIVDIATRGWLGNVHELRNAGGLTGAWSACGCRRRLSETGQQRLADRAASYERGLIARALAAHGGSLKPVLTSLKTILNSEWVDFHPWTVRFFP